MRAEDMEAMKSRILSFLGASEDYVSGQELCERLNVSRTAVWKVINQLRDEGYEIESVQNRGYRILKRPDVITAEEIESRLNTSWAARPVIYHESIGSTNDEARRLAEEGAGSGTLVVAEKQTDGRGRRGRSWVTPEKSAVAMSLVLRPPGLTPSHSSMLTLVMGLAVCAAIRKYPGVDAGIKWPNDVIAGGRKICGILTEMSGEVDYINYIVIGIGINTDVKAFPPELEKTAVSLHELCGEKPDRAELICGIMEEFEKFYEEFMKTQDLRALMDDYNRLLAGKGDRVRVLAPDNEHCGVSEGINADGELLVRLNDGSLERVFAGEVSVRGVYGYV